ncbi:hypothetical protein FRC01_003403 [Tulasnella sp. 417]|nr:hypothetical protein FRC01_003403 [Tulasnella sp. 417]
METFAAELSEAVNDVEDRGPSCKSPPPTTDNNAVKDIELDGEQGTQIQASDEIELNMSSRRVRLDRLSYFRIHTDAIYFLSSEPHGCGGKAEVVKATLKQGDGGHEQQVAVKKLRYYDDINERNFSNEFVHEVDVMARLSHENIVKLIGFMEDLEAGKAWIILSWEPNGNVREFLATGEWEIPERVSLIKDTFAGIEYLHTRQPPICHGDLKSHNILVSAKYRAIIADLGSARILKETEDRRETRGAVPHATGALGIAQAMDEQTGRTQITIVTNSNQLTLTGPAWSLRWAAPEVALGEPQSLASDIWAAGWVCWEVMTNKVPFHELNSEGAIVLKVVEGHVPAVREDTQLSQIISLCSLMTDCWAFDPQNRPNIAQCKKEIHWMPSVSPSGRKASSSNIPSAELLCKMARVHQSRGNLKEAISLVQQALSAASDERTRAEALHELGGLYRVASKFTEAEQYYTQAQEISTRIGDEYGQARALHGMGQTYHYQSKLTQAEDSYIRARSIFSRLGDVQDQALISRALGNVFSGRSQYHEAEELYNQAIDVFALIGDDLGHADTLMRLGELLSTQSEYAKAEEIFNRALEKYSRVGYNLGRANIKGALGDLYRMQGLNTKAVQLLTEARGLYALTGNSKLEHNCSHWLDVVLKQGDSSTASLSVPGNDDVPPLAHGL